jgi:hypothetical protein
MQLQVTWPVNETGGFYNFWHSCRHPPECSGKNIWTTGSQTATLQHAKTSKHYNLNQMGKDDYLHKVSDKTHLEIW